VPDFASQMTIDQLTEKYIAFREAEGIKSATSLRAHNKAISKFFGPMTLAEICEPYALATLCREFHASRPTTDATVRKQLAGLQAALRWAWRQGWITGLPVMVFPPKTPPRDRVLSKNERERLLAAADAYPTLPHIRTYVYLALFTRQYRYAILSLTWDRVRFDEGVIIFLTDDGRETVPMAPRLRAALERAKEERLKGCNYVVQWRGKQVTSIYHALSALLERAELDNITEHDIRRSDEPLAA